MYTYIIDRYIFKTCRCPVFLISQFGCVKHPWVLVLTWSAFLCSRSTCPYEAAGCWGWLLRWCRTAASPPAWWARGRCRVDTWWSGRRWAAAGWSPACRSPRPRCWTSAYEDLWASPPTRPGWSRAPAFQRLYSEIIVINENQLNNEEKQKKIVIIIFCSLRQNCIIETTPAESQFKHSNPSGRSARSLRSRTNRLKSTFYPQAARLLNA